MKIKFSHIMVQLTDSTDRVYVYTSMPTPFPYMEDIEMNMSFECAHDFGEQYVRENFGVTPEIVNTRILK